MVKAILFDFTQTLADSSDGFRAAEKEAQSRIFQDLGAASWDEFLAGYRALRRRFHDAAPNFPRPDLWQEVYLRHARRPDVPLLQKWEREYWETVRSRTALFPETASVLAALAGRFLLGLVTNKQGPGIWEDHTLRRFPQLASLFKAVVVAGDAAVPAKPDPAAFLMCLRRLGVSAAQADEDTLMEVALESGADDVKAEGDLFVVTCPANSFSAVKQALAAKQIQVDSAEIAMVPKSTVKLTGEKARQVLALMETLEDNDDVQNTYANFDVPDEVMAEAEKR